MALSSLILLTFIFPTPVRLPETKFVQVAPQIGTMPFVRSAGKDRAVILIHGLDVHPLSEANVRSANFRRWQESGSYLVEELEKDSDVFAFAYGQSIPVTGVAKLPGLRVGIQHVVELGYREVVLLGHSAGGLVALHFVAEHPANGVTKVVQVCPPNGGSGWSKLKKGVRESQEVFVESLSPSARANCHCPELPVSLECVCVVGDLLGIGDGIVSIPAQWTSHLQDQGIPYVLMKTDHLSAVRTKAHAKDLAAIVRSRHQRWSMQEVEAGRVKLRIKP